MSREHLSPNADVDAHVSTNYSDSRCFFLGQWELLRIFYESPHHTLCSIGVGHGHVQQGWAVGIPVFDVMFSGCWSFISLSSPQHNKTLITMSIPQHIKTWVGH